MYRSAKYRNTLSLIPPLFLGVVILCVNYEIIVWGIRKEILNAVYFVWILIGFLIFIFYLELIYFMFSVMEITSSEIIFTKPLRRFGLFRKRKKQVGHFTFRLDGAACIQFQVKYDTLFQKGKRIDLFCNH